MIFWEYFIHTHKGQHAEGKSESSKEQTLATTLQQRVTPNYISHLKENEIFVFGSNAWGRHSGGAARTAVRSFGAIMGQGHGLQGKSYAINSMSGISDMKEDIDAFCEFAKKNPEKQFLVTPIGCGIAGYRPEQIAPLFIACKDIENVSLPESFWNILGFPETKKKTFNLDRFIEAQSHSYETALHEIQNGRKTSHWIWYIFPQEKGYGRSYNSKFYGLDGIEEAKAYWEHPTLKARLQEITETLLTHKGKRDIYFIMGSQIDVVKLKRCMKLFNEVVPNNVFQEVLNVFYKKEE